MNENNENQEPSEIELLKERAIQMGVNFHPNIGVDKLREKVDAAIKGKPDPTEEVPVIPVSPELNEYQRNQQRRLDAMRLIRVVVACMNPAKQAWEGEIFTVGNDIVGTVKKFVPFNIDAGFHIPHIIYEQLIERQCQIFYTHTDPTTGFKTSKGKLIKEFNVVILPNLTETELHDLAQQQAANNSID